MNHLDKLIEDIKAIDDKSITDAVDNSPTSKIIEGQKVFIWTRIYLKEDCSSVIEGDDFEIRYIPTNESLVSKFVCFGKSNLTKDHRDEITSYNSEDDRKILCLMINEDDLKNRQDIPFVRTLFKTSPYYQYQLIRRNDLTFTNLRTKESVEYIGMDF